MNKPKYLYKSEEYYRIYEFVSEGPKGSIKKMVQFTETGTENVFNLAFGDYDEKTNPYWCEFSTRTYYLKSFLTQ